MDVEQDVKLDVFGAFIQVSLPKEDFKHSLHRPLLGTA